MKNILSAAKLFAVLLITATCANAQTGIIHTFAGTSSSGYYGDGGPATVAYLSMPSDIVIDGSGNLLICDEINQRIRKVNTAGTINTFAGNGTTGFAGDGGAATAAELNDPMGITVDASGNVYIADAYNNRVRKINTSGIISTFAGTGVMGFSGDGGAATAAKLSEPWGVAVDASGNVYISDYGNCRIRKVNTSGIISTYAGSTPGYSGDGGPATSAQLGNTEGIHMDGSGNLYIGDYANQRIRIVYPSGTIATFAGNGTGGYSGDGGAATAAELHLPSNVAFDLSGNVYIADQSNQRVRKVNSSGIISTYAGNGTGGFSGDGSAATAAELNNPVGVAVDAYGSVYVADYMNYRIRRITAGPMVSFTGGSIQGLTVCENSGADPINSLLTITDTTSGLTETYSVTAAPSHGSVTVGSTVTSGTSVSPTGWAYRPTTGYSGTDAFTIQVSDGTVTSTTTINVTVNPLPVVAAITGSSTVCPGGTITLSDATTGGIWSSSNTSIATVGSAGIVTGVAAGTAGISYTVTNSCGSTSQVVLITVGKQIMTTFAGTGAVGYSGDGGPATLAKMNNPHGICVDASNNIYIVDDFNGAIRKVTPSGTISTFAGVGSIGYGGDGGPATAAHFNEPFEAILDGSGNMYISDAWNHRVRKINMSTGIVTTIAGTGIPGFSGDGGPATAAKLNTPAGLAMDLAGNLYVGEINNQRVRMISPAGTISTYAGTGVAGFNGDNIPATTAKLYNPNYLHMDPYNNLLVVDNANHRIRKIDATGTITTIAGNGIIGAGGDGGQATAAQLDYPGGVAFDAAGNMYIATDISEKVRVVNAVTGIITTFAGTGGLGYSGDGGPPTAATMYTVVDVAFDQSGNLLIADQQNNVVREVLAIAPAVASVTGLSSLCVGSTTTYTDSTAGGVWSSSSTSVATVNSSSGLVTGVAAGTATISYSVTFPCGNVTVTRAVTVNALPAAITVGGGGIINTIAGNGTPSYGGDGGPATAAELEPYGIAVDAAGNTYVTDIQRIRKINASGIITTIAGNGIAGYSGDGGAATAAELNGPFGVAVDGTGNIYIAEYFNQRVRKINSTGIISTFAGNGTFGYTGDGGAATAAELGEPDGVAVDGTGNVYIVDYGNNVIRKVNTAGIISTVAGTGIGGYSGDGGAATAAKLGGPQGVAVDGSGNVYIADNWNSRIRKVNSSGVISTFAGNGTAGYSGDGVAATATELYFPYGVAVDGYGNLYIGDTHNSRVRMVNSSGIISTIAGNGTYGFSGDGGTATAAKLSFLHGVAVNGSGDLYLVDDDNNRVREVTPMAGTVCIGSTIALSDATAGGTWSASNTNATVGSTGIVTGVTAGTTTITYMLPTGCYTTTTVTVNSLPAIGTGASVTMCIGSSATLTATGGTAYTWSPATGLSATTGASVTASPGVTTTYTITGTSATGCSNTTTETVTVNPLPVIGAGAGAAICNGSSTTLSATGGVTYAWTPSTGLSATTGATVTASPTATTTYSVIGTSAAGCSNIATETVTVNPLPALFSVTGGGNGCPCVHVGLAFSSVGTNYQLYNGPAAVGAPVAGSASPIDFGCQGVSGTYTVVATISATGCSRTMTGSASVFIGPLPGSISGPGIVCTGSTITVTDTSAGGTWSASNGNATIGTSGIVTGVTAGIDTISYTNGVGCTATKIIAVDPTPGPITGTLSVCTGSTGIAYCGGGGVWSSTSTACLTVGSGSGIITAIALCPVSICYTIPGTGCSVCAPVTINPTPIVSAGTGITICPGTSATLTAVGGTTYTWSPGSSLSATTGSSVTASPTSTTTYTVTGTTAGCSGTATKTVTIGTGITVSAGPNIAICTGSSASITATGGATYTWMPSTGLSATTGATVTAFPTTTTTYTITGTTGACSGSTTKTVSVNSIPTISAGTGVTICSGSSATLTAAGGTTYTWSPSTALSATTGSTVTASPVTTTIYTVTGITAGCSGTAVKPVTVNAAPTISAGSGVTICPGSSTTITATGGTTYTWSPATGLSASTGATVTATPAATTTYTVTGTTAGCSGTATKTVNIGSALTISAGPAIAICSGSSTTLTAAGGTTYTWSPSTGLSSTTGVSVTAHPTSTTTYTITGHSGGCSGIGTTTVTVNALPVISTSPGTAVCTGSSATLTASGSTTYTWSPSTGLSATTGASVTASPASSTTYTVTGTTAGCNGTATTAVTVNALPVISAGPGATICSGSSTTMTATGGTTYTWSPSAGLSATTGTTVTANPIVTTTYTVTGTTAGCSGTATKTVTVVATTGTISGSSQVCVGGTTPLTDGMPGGIWSSSNTARATVGSSSGIVSGMSAGTVTIMYAVTGCTATWPMTINPLPAAITGGSSITCIGHTTTLSDVSPGGTWSSTNPAVASVSGTGVVTGIAGGATIISYTLTSTSCAATRTVTVAAVPAITGLHDLCAWGDTLNAHDSITSGLYTSSLVTVTNTGGGNGIVMSAAAGIGLIIYTLPSGCSVSAAITVDPLPGMITGTNHMTIGGTTTLSNSVPGGTWTSGAPTTASANPTTGVITGITAGSARITYTLPTGCYADTVVHVVSARPGAPAQITQAGESNIRVIPNPNSGIFNISGTINTAKDEEEVAVELTNMLGQVVYRTTLTAHSGKIDHDISLGDVANGMYLLNIKWSAGDKVTHLVVRR